MALAAGLCTIFFSFNLENVAAIFLLLLLHLLDVDVSPEQDSDDHQRRESRSYNDHFPADISIRLDDGIADGRADRVLHLFQ